MPSTSTLSAQARELTGCIQAEAREHLANLGEEPKGNILGVLSSEKLFSCSAAIGRLNDQCISPGPKASNTQKGPEQGIAASRDKSLLSVYCPSNLLQWKSNSGVHTVVRMCKGPVCPTEAIIMG